MSPHSRFSREVPLATAIAAALPLPAAKEEQAAREHTLLDRAIRYICAIQQIDRKQALEILNSPMWEKQQ